ncbi:transcription termination/antitermination protein NusA [Candidatus Sumerlaeota bacterium]|nr:transcription termination/antitermination protein NusA [Candidatus Sumerlaeota bacterium]
MLSGNEALRMYIKQICKEKDLEPHVVVEALEQALVTASKKNLTMYNNARPTIDPDTGELHVYVTKTVTASVANERVEMDLEEAQIFIPDVLEGDEVEVEISPEEFGRIAAQSARQVVMQRLRDAERLKVYAEYRDKIGQVVTAIVNRFEKRDAIVTLGRGEAVLPHSEIPHNARYRFGDRIKVLLLEIDINAKGPIVKVSRTHPDLVIKLFEQEVPEIADRIVKILNVAREPGVRSKISVISNNPDVDPVGACVGMKGSRVQQVVRELENERIDIVPYSTNPIVFIRAALNPVQVKDVVTNEETKVATVIVDKSQLSLAIGRRGQNARLAARLTGWKIDIQAVEEEMPETVEDEIRQQYLQDFLSQMPDLDEQVRLAILGSRKYSSVEAIAEAEPHQLQDIANLESPGMWRPIIEGAKQYAAALAEMKAAEPSHESSDETAAEPSEEDSPVATEAISEEETPLPAEEESTAAAPSPTVEEGQETEKA